MKKIKTLFCLMLVLALTVLGNVNDAFAASISVNSQYIFEPSTLDTLTLNCNQVPQVTVTGSEPYTITDGNVGTGQPMKKVSYNSAHQRGKTLDSTVTVKYNNCGTLNGRAVDMQLVYSEIVTGDVTEAVPYLYWSAFGTEMKSENEWWYYRIEHVKVRVYFYYHGESQPVHLDRAYLTIFSEDKDEGVSSAIATQTYLFENTTIKHDQQKSGPFSGRTYNDVYYGGGFPPESRFTGVDCVSMKCENSNYIEAELYGFNISDSTVGYHLQYTPATATIPDPPTKSVDKSTAEQGDELTYTVNQKISKRFVEKFLYSSLVFTDKLDSNLTYTNNSLKVYDDSGVDVTSTAGTSSFDSSTNTLTYTFNSSYLQNTMKYNGETYKFVFKGKIKERIRATKIDNQSSTKINNEHVLQSNKVTTTLERIESSVTAKYYDKYTNREIERSETSTGYVGDRYSTTKKSIPGYTFVEVKGDSTSGEYDFDPKEVKYYYAKNVDLTVKHLDKDTGKPLVPDETRHLKQGDSYTTQSKDLEGYKLVETPDNANGTMGDTNETVTYTYELIRVNVDITKTLEATDSTEIQNLAGAVFTAESTYFSDLVKIANPETTYVSTTTDSNGHCIIEGLPYGIYTITETTVPDIAYDGKFKLEGNGQVLDNLEITIDQDKTYTYNLEDVAKKMQIKINKEDAETGNITQGDAHLEGAEYTVYRDALCTDPVETLTIQKQADGTYSAESGWYLVGTYYVKETKAPVGYNIDETVYTVEQNPAEQSEEFSNHEITSKEQVIRNDIEIVKNLEETDSTEKQSLAGAVFTATLNSDETKTYESTPTDADGNCIIENLPYGTYTVEETTVPDVAYNGEFYINGATDRSTTFEQFIEVDQGANEPYVWGDITDVAKKMKIKINKEDAETGNITQGDAHLEGAEYTVYRDALCTDPVETLTIQKQEDGTYSAESGWYLVGTYYVKETKAPEGYLIDETVYTVEQNPSEQSEEFTNHEITSKEQVIRNDIEIVKNLEETDSTEKQSLAGAVFTATLNSDNTKTYESTPTDADGNCVIENLPYGTYTVEETTVPDLAYNGEFYVNGAADRSTTFEQFIEVDQGTNEPYVWGDITDVAKKMKIKVNKEDAETGKITQGDAHLEGAEYTVYRDALCTDAVETLTIQKQADGTYSAESGWYLVGTYYVKETKAPEGYLIDETVYTVEQNPAEQSEEFSNHEITSKEQVIRNDIEIVKNLEKTDSTEKQSLAGAVFTATLNSDETKTYESTPTDDRGNCVIKDLPYGTYTVEETTVPDVAYNGEFYVDEDMERKTTFEQFIEVDQGTNDPYVWGDITDVAKKMQITIYKQDSETITQTQGDAHLEGAEYTIYRDEACTDPVETLTIQKQTYGVYSATSGWYLVGTYYVKETKAPEGYNIDEKVYKVEQRPSEQKEEYSTHQITSHEDVIRNDIEIIKSLEATDSSEKQSLEGAVFTATLLSDETQTWESTPTDEEGYCVIEDLPYGTYKVEETTIPDIAYNGEFYANEEIERAKEFEQYVELDKGSNEPYVWEIEDVAKKMQIEIYKEDSETGSQAQEDAFLEGAEYTVYRDEECTDAIETLTIEKNEDGTYSAKSGEYLVGTYYVKETKAPEGYDMDETLYVVEQDAKEQEDEYSYHNLTSQDKYIPIPETGDILVYTLSGVLMISVLGIVYVVRKNRKVSE